MIPEFVGKNYYAWVLIDTDVDVKMIQEHSSQSGDFGEIDIFVYKFGWIGI